MAVEIVAMLGATFAHAAVGQLTYVPAPDARRIDFKLILKSCFFFFFFHEYHGPPNAVDVAQAGGLFSLFTFLCHVAFFFFF